jgi:ABC-2 type transport system permease protein
LTAPGGGWLKALAELRVRLLWRRLRGAGGIPELVARIAVLVVVIPAGLVFAGLAATGAFHAVRAGGGLRSTVPAAALFFGVWQTWTAVSLSLSDRDALDLRRFLVYPVPPARVYGYGLVASVIGDPFAVFWCLLLVGAFVGAALARPGPWVVVLAAAQLAFAVATAALVALLQELLGRLLRGKRVRELAIAGVYVATAALVAWGAGTSGRNALQTLRTLQAIRWIAYPAALATEAVRALYAGHVAAALPWVAALAAAGLATAWAAYRLALAEARSGGEGARARGARAGQGWRLPGRIGPLVEKEAKYLARHPLTSILALVVPAFAAFVAAKAAPHLPVEAGEVLRALPLLGFALYGHLVTQVFWLNAFGWDRGGARLYYLAPIRLADAVVAKNVATYALSLGLFGASAVALAAAGGPPPAWSAAAAVALHAGVAPWFLLAGNVVSILNPRAASHTLQRGGRLAPMSALAGAAILSAGGSLFAVPVLVAIRLDAPWLLAIAWSVLGVAGVVTYRALLPATARLLARRREAVLDAVAGDED